MSTLDKVNAELVEMQRGLADLKHYTDEIGKSKAAANSVIEASQEFLKVFKSRVDAINKQMEFAAGDFKSQVGSTSEAFKNAGLQFESRVYESQKTLDRIGGQLEVAAKNVNDLAQKIEAINILGHFDRLHSAFADLQSELSAIDRRRVEHLARMEQVFDGRIKHNNKVQVIGFSIVSAFLLIILVLLLVK